MFFGTLDSDDREREMENQKVDDKLVRYVEEVYDKCVTLAERVTVL